METFFRHFLWKCAYSIQRDEHGRKESCCNLGPRLETLMHKLWSSFFFAALTWSFAIHWESFPTTFFSPVLRRYATVRIFLPRGGNDERCAKVFLWLGGASEKELLHFLGTETKSDCSLEEAFPEWERKKGAWTIASLFCGFSHEDETAKGLKGWGRKTY